MPLSATDAGYALMKAAYTKDAETATATAEFIILGIDIDDVPATLSLADTLDLVAVETPWVGGDVEWTIDSGTGDGDFDDTETLTPVFTPSDAGSITLKVETTYGGVTVSDTVTFTIVAPDVDITTAPTQVVTGEDADLVCTVSPTGGTLTWSIISGGGRAVRSPERMSSAAEARGRFRAVSRAVPRGGPFSAPFLVVSYA